jgi:hypothetical protein
LKSRKIGNALLRETLFVPVPHPPNEYNDYVQKLKAKCAELEARRARLEADSSTKISAKWLKRAGIIGWWSTRCREEV